MPENEERWQSNTPRTIESLAMYVQAHLDSLRKDVKRVLAVIEERQIEKEVALIAERLKTSQEADRTRKTEIEQLRDEIDGAKKQMIRYLIQWLVAIIGVITVAALTVIFKLK